MVLRQPPDEFVGGELHQAAAEQATAQVEELPRVPLEQRRHGLLGIGSAREVDEVKSGVHGREDLAMGNAVDVREHGTHGVGAGDERVECASEDRDIDRALDPEGQNHVVERGLRRQLLPGPHERLRLGQVGGLGRGAHDANPGSDPADTPSSRR